MWRWREGEGGREVIAALEDTEEEEEEEVVGGLMDLPIPMPTMRRPTSSVVLSLANPIMTDPTMKTNDEARITGLRPNASAN